MLITKKRKVNNQAELLKNFFKIKLSMRDKTILKINQIRNQFVLSTLTLLKN